MALKPCKECKQEVSTKAKQCPHCGVSNPTITAKDQIVGAVILVAIIAGIWLWLSGGDDTEQSAEKAPEKTPEELAQEEAACREDLQCWGGEHGIAAAVMCKEPIERLAQYDYEWTDGFMGSKLSRFRWLNKEQGTVTYIGDEIKFQNGFGAWQHYTYTCDFDPTSREVLSVNATPGRI